MKYVMGIDIGSSSTKAAIYDEHGHCIETASQEYPTYNPHFLWSEQNPDDWLKAALSVAKKAADGLCGELSISFSGQMHGLVMLDDKDNIIRPALLWNDGRSTQEVNYLNNTIGKDFLLSKTGNIAFAGFTAPKLMWVKNNEHDNFCRIAKIMLPKDYVAYRFTGKFCTDVSDASGTLFFDVENRRWSSDMLKLLQITERQLPEVLESYEIAGEIKPEIADKIGFSGKITIVIGAGDNAASAIGNGTVSNGDCNISLGTSGTIFVASDRIVYDSNSTIHAFDSANGGYHYLACILSAAGSQDWWINKILKADYNTDGFDSYIGKNEVMFIPYLSGERSPVNMPDARATFCGLSISTSREQMSLAVLEGVAYALRHNLEELQARGVNITKSKICGGGSKNLLWLNIIASALNIELEVPDYQQGGVLGAAILAAHGIMEEKECRSFADGFYNVNHTVLPNRELVSAYDAGFRKYIECVKRFYQ